MKIIIIILIFAFNLYGCKNHKRENLVDFQNHVIEKSVKDTSIVKTWGEYEKAHCYYSIKDNKIVGDYYVLSPNKDTIEKGRYGKFGNKLESYIYENNLITEKKLYGYHKKWGEFINFNIVFDENSNPNNKESFYIKEIKSNSSNKYCFYPFFQECSFINILITNASSGELIDSLSFETDTICIEKTIEGIIGVELKAAFLREDGKYRYRVAYFEI